MKILVEKTGKTDVMEFMVHTHGGDMDFCVLTHPSILFKTWCHKSVIWQVVKAEAMGSDSVRVQ